MWSHCVSSRSFKAGSKIHCTYMSSIRADTYRYQSQQGDSDDCADLSERFSALSVLACVGSADESVRCLVARPALHLAFKSVRVAHGSSCLRVLAEGEVFGMSRMSAATHVRLLSFVSQEVSPMKPAVSACWGDSSQNEDLSNSGCYRLQPGRCPLGRLPEPSARRPGIRPLHHPTTSERCRRVARLVEL